MSKATGIEDIVTNGYCIGCGVCAAINDSPFTIKMDELGRYQAVLGKAGNKEHTLAVCPFSNEALSEDKIGKKLFGGISGVHHDAYLGYSLKSYVGFVSSDTYRDKGSSGGFGSWLAVSLLQEHLVDYVIHVKPVENSSILFAYSISSTLEDIREGAKSKYYPIELSRVLGVVKDNPGRYLLIGVPCFIKAVRLLSEEEQIFKERIVFTIGLICGHLKTDRFAKAIGWELGIHPNKLDSIDFRVKMQGSDASVYGITVKEKGIKEAKTSLMKDLLVYNWGHGLFRYNACDYCDDVLAETADITIGDAWLSGYIQDGRGANVVVVRNLSILSMLEKRYQELTLEEITADKVYESQAGGFRNRREGLSYRLYLKDLKEKWRPVKRVAQSERIPKKRKKIYEERILLLLEANRAYKQALEGSDFLVFRKTIEPALHTYNKLYRRSFVVSFVDKLYREIERHLKK